MAFNPKTLAPVIKLETQQIIRVKAAYQTFLAGFFANTFQGQYRFPEQVFTIGEIEIGDLRGYDEDVAWEVDRVGSKSKTFSARHAHGKQLRITDMEALASDVDLRAAFVADYASKSAAAIDRYLLDLILDAPVNALGEQDIATDAAAAEKLLTEMIEVFDYAQGDSEASTSGLTLLAPPEFCTALVHTPTFVQSELGAARLFAGEIGTYSGVRVIKSKRTITGVAGARKATLLLADGSKGGEKIIDYTTSVKITEDYLFDGIFLKMKTHYGAVVSDPNAYVTAEVEVRDSTRKEGIWDKRVAPGTQTPWGVLRPETKTVANGAFLTGGSMASVGTRPSGVLPAEGDAGKGVQEDLNWGAAGVDVDGNGVVGDED